MSSILNKSAMRDFILSKVKSLTPSNPLTRVSSLAIEKYEAKLRSWIIDDVKRHPTIGKTFSEVM